MEEDIELPDLLRAESPILPQEENLEILRPLSPIEDPQSPPKIPAVVPDSTSEWRSSAKEAGTRWGYKVTREMQMDVRRALEKEGVHVIGRVHVHSQKW